MRIEVHLDLQHLIDDVRAVAPEALGEAMEEIRTIAVSRTPVETGRLAGSAEVKVDGDQASLEYAGPYARYQEYTLDLRHETGQALYLTTSIEDGADRAREVLTNNIKKAIS